MNYVLSPNYQLKKLDYLQKKFPNAPEVKTLDTNENFVLVKQNKKDFIINLEIFLFLEFLQTPQSIETLSAEFPEEPDLKTFLSNMLKRGVVIEASKLNQVAQLAEKQQRFQIGDYLDSYKIIELLTAKSEVEIYLAEKEQKVIIKALRIPNQLEKDKIQLLKKKFSREFKLMEELPPNPNLSQVISFNEAEGYAILKFIEGETLQKFLKTQKPNSKVKAHLIRQLIDALAFLHGHQIVHGDLHHRNIIVSSTNHLTLLDFGLSHLEGPTNKEKLRKGGLDVYLPPERISPSSFQILKKPADFASDIYQLGILMYLIIFQQFPFKGFTWDDLYGAIQKGEVVYDLKEEELARFILIIKRCLKQNPIDRYEHVEAIFLNSPNG